MKIRLTWINQNKGGSRDEAGFWVSTEGRFSIGPNYRHTIYPDSYTVQDRLERDANGKPTQTTSERVRDCKAWAEQRALATLRREIPPRMYPEHWSQDEVDKDGRCAGCGEHARG